MIRVLTELLRLKLSLLNGVAAVGGYLLFPAALERSQVAATAVGVTLLAAGGSAMNQVQERDLDSRMTRTRLRPLPMGKLTPTGATAIGAGLILVGLLVLTVIGGHLPAALAAAALCWYLAVYTPLKRRTSLALPVGALCGAFPPLVGWCLAGGAPTDFRIIFLAGLLFLWQIPHFWLCQRRCQDDYQKAGIPLFRHRSGEAGQDPFFRVWITALGVATLLLPAFGIAGRPLAAFYVIFPLVLLPLTLFCRDHLLFRYLNLFPLFVSFLLLIQKRF